jgi:hypothetical protein
MKSIDDAGIFIKIIRYSKSINIPDSFFIKLKREHFLYPSLLLKLLKVDEINDNNIPKINAQKNPSI